MEKTFVLFFESKINFQYAKKRKKGNKKGLILMNSIYSFSIFN